MAEANLIVTYAPTHTDSAKKEITEILKEAGERGKILGCDEGIAEVSVKDARAIVKSLEDLNKEKFSYTFAWVPVDKWCKAVVADMQKIVKKLSEEIGDEEKWKMDLNLHKSKESGRDLIMKLTAVIEKKKVDLNNPEKIVKVVVIGNKAAVSLLEKGELFSAAK